MTSGSKEKKKKKTKKKRKSKSPADSSTRERPKCRSQNARTPRSRKRKKKKTKPKSPEGSRTRKRPETLKTGRETSLTTKTSNTKRERLEWKGKNARTAESNWNQGPRPYDPFTPETACDDEDSDCEGKTPDTDGTPKPIPSREDMPLLPALGRRLFLRSADNAELSPAEREWERQRRELGERSKALDQLMSMVGLEEVKREFLNIKATIAAAKQRKGKLRAQDPNLVLVGNAGTGKRTVAGLYRTFLGECGVWACSDSPYYKPVSGFDFQFDKDVEDLDKSLANWPDGSGAVRVVQLSRSALLTSG